MITAADKRVLEALASLEGNHHFEDVMAWLQNSLEQTLGQIVMERDEIIMRQLQGAASDLKDFTDTATNARKLIANNR